MKSSNIAILSASFVVISLLFVYAFSLKRDLENSENNVNELRKQMQKAEETFTILNEMNDRQNRVICDYQNELKRMKDEQIKKISIIEKSEDACDWLDAPVPYSVGLLFGAAAGGDGSCADETSSGVDNSM